MKLSIGLISGVVTAFAMPSHSLLAFQAADPVSLPHIQQMGSVKQLIVDGKPYIALAGELHNSTASNVQQIQTVLDRVSQLHVNTVVSTVSWELLEPQEGKYDYSLVDAQIQEAQKHGLHLVLIWFGSWKNGESTYAPIWVKTDHKRFPLQSRRQRVGVSPNQPFGRSQRDNPLSPFSEATMKADAKAYRSLMHHLKENDPTRTVIMMQVENEIGLLGDSRDRSILADEAWTKPVPSELMKYLTQHKDTLLPETKEVWATNNYKSAGTWSEVFGTSEWAEEAFMAWNYAQFVNHVASEGKHELDLPMYVNAWLGPQPGEVLPGDWPSGGPVSRVMDIWRAAAPAIDFYAPDIYVDDYKGTTALYTRSGNPLFIPEARDQAGNLFWAIGKYAALGWSVFGVDDLRLNGQMAKSYQTLQAFLPQLAEWQSQGKVSAALLLEGQESETVDLGGYAVTFSKPARRGPAAGNPELLPTLQAGGVSLASRVLPPDTRPFCIVINTAPDEFVMVGSNISSSFATSPATSSHAMIASIQEGSFQKGVWVPGRTLNGDEGRPALAPMQWTSDAETLMAIKVRLYKSVD